MTISIKKVEDYFNTEKGLNTLFFFFSFEVSVIH